MKSLMSGAACPTIITRRRWSLNFGSVCALVPVEPDLLTRMASSRPLLKSSKTTRRSRFFRPIEVALPSGVVMISVFRPVISSME